jgi:hypothetical protein
MTFYDVDRHKLCAICRHWQGDAEPSFNPKTRKVGIKTGVTAHCPKVNAKRSATSGIGCYYFEKEFLYQ